MANSHKTSAFTLILLSQCAILFLGLVLTYWLSPIHSEPTLDESIAIGYGVVLAIVTLIIFVAVYRLGGNFSAQLLIDIRRVTGLFIGYSWCQLLVVSCLAGVGEELLFRAFLQGWLTNYWGVGWAILVASVVFGVLHYLSFAYFVSAFLMSIAFGLGYYLSGSLLMVIVWHGFYDLIALVVMVKYPSLISANK